MTRTMLTVRRSLLAAALLAPVTCVRGVDAQVIRVGENVPVNVGPDRRRLSTVDCDDHRGER